VFLTFIIVQQIWWRVHGKNKTNRPKEFNGPGSKGSEEVDGCRKQAQTKNGAQPSFFLFAS
jgi:hypothetical protein